MTTDSAFRQMAEEIIAKHPTASRWAAVLPIVRNDIETALGAAWAQGRENMRTAVAKELCDGCREDVPCGGAGPNGHDWNLWPKATKAATHDYGSSMCKAAKVRAQAEGSQHD